MCYVILDCVGDFVCCVKFGWYCWGWCGVCCGCGDWVGDGWLDCGCCVIGIGCIVCVCCCVGGCCVG